MGLLIMHQLFAGIRAKYTQRLKKGIMMLDMCLTWWTLMVFPGLPLGVHCLGRTVGSRWLLLPLWRWPGRHAGLIPSANTSPGKAPAHLLSKKWGLRKTHPRTHWKLCLSHKDFLKQWPCESWIQNKLSFQEEEELQRHSSWTKLMSVTKRQLRKNTWEHVSPLQREPCKGDTVENDQPCNGEVHETNFVHLSHPHVTCDLRA